MPGPVGPASVAVVTTFCRYEKESVSIATFLADPVSFCV